MKVNISEKHSFGDNYLIWRTIYIDNADCTRAADIEISHYVDGSQDPYYSVTLYKGSRTTIHDIKIGEWRKAKKLALAWVED